MQSFERIAFHGKFRDYQQRVLDNAPKYMGDGKLHIVAAPGSGKTVLGLELIRRQGKPCLILSPTTAIREQWGKRFKDLFLTEEDDFDALYSGDLHRVALVNSITYQALYTAMEKVASADAEDTDLSDLDILAEMRAHGIGTVCLDEAHHLKNEWQKALETFVSKLDAGMTVISLTATPPYDAEGGEWERYISVCGEIDEEIFVPELVGQRTLCPHQDYVYFNYPTEEEAAVFETFRENAAEGVELLRDQPCMRILADMLNEERDLETLFSSAKEYVSLCTLLTHYGYELKPRLIRELTAGRGLPRFSIEHAECAIRFLLEGDILIEEDKAAITAVLRRKGLTDKRRVALTLNEKLRRTLLSSVGKLRSIATITESEYAALGPSLRMLVLTDYIKKEYLSRVGSDEALESVNIVSIFETLRRLPDPPAIGVLSGTLIILPDSVDLSGLQLKYTRAPIGDTGYSEVTFAGHGHRAVDAVSRLFGEGKVQVLIGTKSLLGEGWDSPCINSLILASFVGSFVLSNQMRGRAIRMDPANPDKASNIWHLVTVEPSHLFKEKKTEQLEAYLNRDDEVLCSCDFDMLKRRFDSFMGPHYETGVIEGGIERLTAIRPPFDKEGIQRINAEMLALSRDRGRIASLWTGEVGAHRFAVSVETAVPAEARVPIFTFGNVLLPSLVVAAEAGLLGLLWYPIVHGYTPLTVFMVAAMIALSVVTCSAVKRLVLHANPARSIKTLGVAVYKSLRDCGVIADSAKVEAVQDKALSSVSLFLRNASVHDQNIFNTAMGELLSPIENPRYILIKKTRSGRYVYEQSYACPSVLGKKKEFAEVLTGHLKRDTGDFEAVYTHREDGRRLILKCRKRAYVTRNLRAAGKKYKVTHWE